MKLHLTGCILLMMLISIVSDPVAAQSTPLRGPKDATNQYSGVVFGPIDANDTLWRVASRYRQNPNLSIYQVMVAIYELNPDAFEQNNLNLMVDGATLKLPSERYIARIDKQKARQKAEADDAAFARMVNQPGDSLNNLKPPVPLVNQDDLTQTKTQIEQQLNQIDASQARQFEELRDQFAASIDSVQMLLDDNRKLYERIEQINTDLSALRGRVDDDVEVKVDEQLALQRELRELILSDKAAKEAEQSNSLMNALTSPMALIAGTGLLTFSAIAGLIVWLMKRKSKPEEEITLPPKETTPEPEEGIADLSTALESELGGEELSDEELFNDDDLLDDVLSTELEESLNDDDSFADLNDDMLVPDDSKEEGFEAGDSALDQDDLDSLFDDEFSNQDSDEAIDLSDADDLLDSFEEEEGNDDLADFSEESEPELDEAEQTSDEELAALLENPEQVYQSEPAPDADVDDDSGNVTDDDDIDAILAAQQPAAESAAPAVSEEDETPEISIDDLLEENKLSEEEKANLPVDDGPVGDEMLEKLDDEISQQSQAIDRLTDSIINEMDQIEMMGDLAGDLDDEDEDSDLLDAPIETESADSDESKLQSLDDITEDLDEIDFDNIENADAFDDPLSDELLAELEAELPEEDDDIETPSAETDEDDFDESQFEQEISDDLTDELLKELEGDDVDEDVEPEVAVDDEADDFDESDLEDDLTRELLSELEQNDEDDDVVEVEPDQQPVESDEAIDTDDAIAEESLDFDDPLTDDLLAELSGDEEGEGEDNDEQTQALSEELDELDTAQPAYVSDDEISVEDTTEGDEELPPEEAESQASSDTTESLEPAEDSADTDDVSDDALEQALAEFDQQMMDDIPSFSGEPEPAEAATSEAPDDDILDQALEDFESEIDSFELAQEQDGVLPGENEASEERASRPGDFDELEDVPGLDEWLNDSNSGEEAAILDELDNSEFDELLGAIDNEDEAKPEQEIEELALDNPDLDLNALFTEQPEIADTDADSEEDSAPAEEDYVDVETLMAQADDVPDAEDERDLDLDVSLSEFSGVSDDDDVFDIDKDAGQNANLDLARVYIEMDDSEAARELLEEVMSEGSEAQQAEAKKLIETL